MLTRLEADSIGTMEVPAKAYYGVQSLRAKHNFNITGCPLHPAFINNLARIKKAAAMTNMTAHVLDEQIGQAIIRACDEIIARKAAQSVYCRRHSGRCRYLCQYERQRGHCQPSH